MAKTASKTRNARRAKAKTAAKTAPSAAGSTGAKKKVLHMGISSAAPGQAETTFKPGEWDIVRLDPDPRIKADIQTSMINLEGVESEAYDAVWMPHVLQRMFAPDGFAMLQKLHGVVRDEGFIVVTVPDVQLAAAYAANNRLLEVLYNSPAGDITPHDMIYGFSRHIASGLRQMAHRRGFTAESLGVLLRDAGFSNVTVRPETYDLTAIAYKYDYDNPKRAEKLSIFSRPKDKNTQSPAASAPPPQATKAGPVRSNVATDNIDQAPMIWKPLNLGLKK